MPTWLLVCCALGSKGALGRGSLEEVRPLGLPPLRELRAHPVFSLSPLLCFSASRKWAVLFSITFSLSQNQRQQGQELRPKKSLNLNQNKCFLLLDERSQLCVTMMEKWTNTLYQSSVFIWSHGHVYQHISVLYGHIYEHISVLQVLFSACLAMLSS